jgi:putative tricarboxylic transport membrane protein
VTSDRLFGAVCLVIGAAFIWGAASIETGFIVDPLGPSTFPIIIGGLLMVSAVIMIARPDPEPDWPSAAGIGEIGLAIAVLVAYALLLKPIGFVPATTLAAAALGWRLGARPLWAIAGGAGIAFGIYVVFHLVLGLSLARGPLGF